MQNLSRLNMNLLFLQILPTGSANNTGLTGFDSV